MGLKANLTTSWEPFETSHHICHLLLPLERSIWNKLISAVTGCYICNDKERVLISLPTRHSGLVIPVFHETAEIEFMNSSKNHIRTYNIRYNRRQSRETQNWNKKKTMEEKYENVIERLTIELNDKEKRLVDISTLTEVSYWLKVLPITEFGFELSKQPFWDSIRPRYGWENM